MDSYFRILELVGKGAWAVFCDLERATYTVTSAGAILLGLWLCKRNLLFGTLVLAGGGIAVIFPFSRYRMGTMTLLLIAAYALSLAVSLTIERLRTGT
jgi:hypothetical protein